MSAAEKLEAALKAELVSNEEQGPTSAFSLLSDNITEQIDEPELDFDNLDLTNEEIDFDELDELIDKFQQDERVKEALLKGLDMRDYGKQVEASLFEEENAAVDDYIQTTQHLLDLHNEINGCDEILTRMESLLSRFQSDLGNISGEIKTLQDQSSSLSIKLNNRKQLSDKLGEYIDHVVITPQFARDIFESEVNESYVQYIVALNRKMVYVNQMKQKNKDVLSYEDVDPQLKSLRNKATSKIRKFLLQQIHLLKRPKTNTNVIQQNVLLKHKLFYSFLNKHNPEIATEVRNAYVDTMSDIYFSNGRIYLDHLMRLHKPVGNKNDLLGGRDDSGKSWFSFRFQAERPSVFSLNSRDQIMDDIQANPIIPHESAKKGLSFTYEVLFRSMNFYLIDLVTAEYNFCLEFFGRDVDTFSPIFRLLLDYYVENVRSYLKGTHDCIGILLTIKVARGIQQIMLTRRINALQGYFLAIAGLLWPRFSHLFSIHVESIKNVDREVLGDKGDIRPHFIVRRYAELVSAIRVIGVTYTDGRLETSLSAMRGAMEGLLPLLQTQIKEERMKAAFYINNYDLILSIFGASSDSSSPETARFLELKQKQIVAFTKPELMLYFESLISFVHTFEDRPDTAPPVMINKIIPSFANGWKASIEKIHKDIMTSNFSNFKCGAEILKYVLEELAKYYERFCEIAKQSSKQNGSSLSEDLVPPTNVHYEITKYNISFV